MVLILFGTILASTSGFIAQEFIPKNEIFYIQDFKGNKIQSDKKVNKLKKSIMSLLRN